MKCELCGKNDAVPGCWGWYVPYEECEREAAALQELDRERDRQQYEESVRAAKD